MSILKTIFGKKKEPQFIGGFVSTKTYELSNEIKSEINSNLSNEEILLAQFKESFLYYVSNKLRIPKSKFEITDIQYGGIKLSNQQNETHNFVIYSSKPIRFFENPVFIRNLVSFISRRTMFLVSISIEKSKLWEDNNTINSSTTIDEQTKVDTKISV